MLTGRTAAVITEKKHKKMPVLVNEMDSSQTNKNNITGFTERVLISRVPPLTLTQN